MSTIKQEITGPSGHLEGMLHLPKGEPRAIAVIAHPLPTMGGTMENKIVTTLAKTFTELGFAALRFNFRGVGASAGNFDDGNGEMQDLLAAIAHIRNTFAELPLVLAGFSFGGYVAACAAQQIQTQKLVLIAPAVARFAMPAVPPDTLVIHGELDEVIPLADALDWARQQHLPILVFPETGHFFHGRLNQLKQSVLREFNGCAI